MKEKGRIKKPDTGKRKEDRKRLKEELRAADAAMFATVNPSVGGHGEWSRSEQEKDLKKSHKFSGI
jgi:hypothetical protein